MNLYAASRLLPIDRRMNREECLDYMPRWSAPRWSLQRWFGRRRAKNNGL